MDAAPGNLDSDTRSIGCEAKAPSRKLKAQLVQCRGSEGALQLRDDREISSRIVGGSGERILNLKLVLPIADLPGNVRGIDTQPKEGAMTRR